MANIKAAAAERPRIATLLPFPLSHKGGISTFVGEFIAALEAEFVVDARLIACDRFTARPGRPLAQMSVAMRQLVELLRLKPDIVHTHEHPVLLAAAIAYAALAGRDVCVAHTIHVQPSRRRSLWKRVLLGWLLGRCSVVTAVSRATASSLDSIACPVPEDVRIIRGAARIRVLGRGDDAAEKMRAALSLGNGPMVCQISPLNLPDKVAGVVSLVEAIALVRESVPDVQLLIVGGGALRAQVERAAFAAGVADCTWFTDYLDDVSAALALTDVYCQITYQDACPLSLLEAMYCGKPLVATRTGGIPEVVTDGFDGLLVDGDARQVADSILNLLRNPELARGLGRRAAETARGNFTWERVAAEFAGAYGFATRPADVPLQMLPTLPVDVGSANGVYA